MDSRWPALFVALLVTASCKPQAEQHGGLSQQVRGLGFTLMADPSLYASSAVLQAPRLTQQENGEDIPLDVAPTRVQFAFKAVAASVLREKADPRFALGGHITVIPLQDTSVPDYDLAYPTFHASAKALRELLAKRPTTFPIERSVPDLNPVEASQSFHAKVHYLDSAWCSGICFLTQYAQDSNPVESDHLSFVFQGLSKDGRHYITAELPIGHRSLQGNSKADVKEVEAHYEAYLRSIEGTLNKAKGDSFAPSLTKLDAMFLSLRPEK